MKYKKCYPIELKDVYCPECESFEIECNPYEEDYRKPCEYFSVKDEEPYEEK